jgi:hypothetical protein
MPVALRMLVSFFFVLDEYSIVIMVDTLSNRWRSFATVVPSMFAEEGAYLRRQSCFTIRKRPTTEPELHTVPHSQELG